MLLTGTGIVPPDTFTLEAGDGVRIEIAGIGVLENPVGRRHERLEPVQSPERWVA